MVAGSAPEPSPDAGGEFAALLRRIEVLERAQDEAARASKFPFVVGHNGIADFQIIKSPTNDGTADILMGNGAGGKLLQVTTDTLYGTKILRILDQNGSTMMSTDALAGYGLGTPSYPFVFAGYESNTLSGATSQGTARELARGTSFVYNPATFINSRVRLFSTTAETVKMFAQWKDGQGNLNNTADVTWNLAANTVTVLTNDLKFGKLWDANDMNTPCAVFLKAYCTSGTPANVNVTASYQDGYGVSKRWYTDNSPSWAV
jgi:hypothetical protein